MRVQVFDDGSTITFDDDNNVVSVTDNSGAAVPVPPPGGSPIVQQFAQLFNGVVRSAAAQVVAGLTPKTAAAGAPQTSSAWSPAKIQGLLLVAGGLFLVSKLVK